jgi:hypothetical protein
LSSRLSEDQLLPGPVAGWVVRDGVPPCQQVGPVSRPERPVDRGTTLAGASGELMSVLTKLAWAREGDRAVNPDAVMPACLVVARRIRAVLTTKRMRPPVVGPRTTVLTRSS